MRAVDNMQLLPRTESELDFFRMSTAEILRALPKLKPEERRALRAKLNELDGVSDDAWIDGGELTEEEKATLDARLAEYEKNPEAGSSWEEVEARLRMQLQG